MPRGRKHSPRNPDGTYTGKVCVKHPELNGLRCKWWRCVGCETERYQAWKAERQVARVRLIEALGYDPSDESRKWSVQRRFKEARRKLRDQKAKEEACREEKG